MITRRASRADFPAVLELARRALGWTDTDTGFLEWKHLENPFGESPMWVALDGERVVGFRAFMRWDLVRPNGELVHAVRAVDTATDPDHQGQGIFTRLTREAVRELPAEGVSLIFNTPNDKSRPGYLKMGWQEVGPLTVSVRPTRLRFLAVARTARRAAGRDPLPTSFGDAPTDAFADTEGLEALLAAQPRAVGLATRHTAASLRWRYGFDPLGYRVLGLGARPDAGLAVFRRRARGDAVEGVLCELLPPAGSTGERERATRALLQLVGDATEGDYVIRLAHPRVTRSHFVRLPHVGPVLVGRALDALPVPQRSAWALTMGDVELF